MKLKALLLTLIFATTSAILTARNCTTEYAYGMAIAYVDHIADLAYCNNQNILVEYCVFEAERKYESAQNTSLENFNICCCSENLTCCNG